MRSLLVACALWPPGGTVVLVVCMFHTGAAGFRSERPTVTVVMLRAPLSESDSGGQDGQNGAANPWEQGHQDTARRRVTVLTLNNASAWQEARLLHSLILFPTLNEDLIIIKINCIMKGSLFYH